MPIPRHSMLKLIIKSARNNILAALCICLAGAATAPRRSAKGCRFVSWKALGYARGARVELDDCGMTLRNSPMGPVGEAEVSPSSAQQGLMENNSKAFRDESGGDGEDS
jgi:hypothetical protein